MHYLRDAVLHRQPNTREGTLRDFYPPVLKLWSLQCMYSFSQMYPPIVHKAISSEVLSPISKPFSHPNIEAGASDTNTWYLNVSLYAVQVHVCSPKSTPCQTCVIQHPFPSRIYLQTFLNHPYVTLGICSQSLIRTLIGPLTWKLGALVLHYQAEMNTKLT